MLKPDPAAGGRVGRQCASSDVAGDRRAAPKRGGVAPDRRDGYLPWPRRTDAEMAKLLVRLGWAGWDRRCPVLRGDRLRAGRADQQHLDCRRRDLYVRDRLPLLRQFHRAKVMALDPRRATPAERLRDGHDFEPTNKWIVFGHHFAAIAGPGPLVGRRWPRSSAICPARSGSCSARCSRVRPGFVVLFASMRRDGKSLGEMRREIGPIGA